MPLPLSDVTQAYRSNPEKTEEAVHKIQSCLTRNQMQRTLPKQTLQLQQSIVTSSSEQMVNEMCLSVQKHIDMLSAFPGRETGAEILCAEDAIKDANLSISILPLLYEAGNIPHQNSKLQHKLECLTEEASQACSQEIQAIMQATLDTTQSLCPKILQKSDIREQLIDVLSKRILLQEGQSLNAILDQLLVDVFGKLNEIKLSATTAVANQIIDEALEDLDLAQSKLAGSLPKPTEELHLLQADTSDYDMLLKKCWSLLNVSETSLATEEVGVSLLLSLRR
uniref:CARMIL C-terminal domain-containing protein n=1 Tax=Sphenodon punctatus TaxID=8508 RepID=A0A8D0LC20_SPHPU